MSKKKIMVADDDPDILEVITLLLEDNGYDVHTTLNGDDVPGLHSGNLPDLLLLDIWMSGRDGRDLCKLIKSQDATRNVPVILISANNDVKKIAQEYGAEDYIAKPFEIKHFLEVITRYV
jgi:CheY-like chemotaxis protein